MSWIRNTGFRTPGSGSEIICTFMDVTILLIPVLRIRMFIPDPGYPSKNPWPRIRNTGYFLLNIYVNTVVVLVLLRIRILRFNSMRIAIRIQGANQCGSGQTLPSHLLEFFHENIFVFCIGGGVQQLDRWEGTTLFAWSAWCAWFRQWLKKTPTWRIFIL